MFYNLSNILQCNTNVNFILSRPMVGKTYAICKKIIDDYIDGGSTAVYVVRTKNELRYIKFAFMKNFDIHIEEMTCGKYNAVCYKETKFFLCRIEDDKMISRDDKCFCKCFSISSVSTNDGLNFDFSVDLGYRCASTANTILLDNFLQYKYLTYEPERFFALVEYIVGTNYAKNAKIFLTGNTARKPNPYFEFMKISNEDIKPGKISVVKSVVNNHALRVGIDVLEE